MVDGLGDEDDGLLWERNPEKHRRVSKTMSPAFSGKSLRAKVPIMNKYIDLFMERMKKIGTTEEGVDLSSVCYLIFPAIYSSLIECVQWLNWLCMDTAADLACNWEMNQVRDGKIIPTHGNRYQD